MAKNKLRKSIMKKLKIKSNKEKKRIEENLTKQLLSSTLWQTSEIIGITISMAIEWDTKPIIRAAWDQGKKVCVPKAYSKENKLVFYKIDSFDQLENIYYGLSEPIPEKTEQMEKEAIDLLIVPGLVFNKQGFRIGFGGGYYDRFLIDFPNQTCSLMIQEQFIDKLPLESHDIPVNHLVTEDGILKLS